MNTVPQMQGHPRGTLCHGRPGHLGCQCRASSCTLSAVPTAFVMKRTLEPTSKHTDPQLLFYPSSRCHKHEGLILWPPNCCCCCFQIPGGRRLPVEPALVLGAGLHKFPDAAAAQCSPVNT